MKNLNQGTKGDLIIKFDIDLVNCQSNDINSDKLLNLLKLFDKNEAETEQHIKNNIDFFYIKLSCSTN
jgi:hypothetical protein